VGDSEATRTLAVRPRVLFVGTSLTAGYGLDPDEAYPAVLQRLADSADVPVEMVNAGLSGETSAGALRRMDWLLRGDARVIVIETGANDGLRGLRVDSTRANIRAIIAAVRRTRPDARMLLVQMEAPPNLGARYTADFQRMFQEIAASESIPLAPFLLEGVAGREDLNQADGIHPTAEGARVAAQNVWRVLRPVIEDAAGPASRRP